MAWDESDGDLESEWNNSVQRQQDLNLKLTQERDIQNKINALKMQQIEVETDVIIDDETTMMNIMQFVMPKNFAGNDMDSDYRHSQKVELIENIYKLLGE